MDAPPPPPAAPAAAPYVYAANDERPRGAREEELCASASHSDYLYMGASLAAFAGLTYLDASYFKYVGNDPSSSMGPAARLPGPALVGLSWGFFVGGAWLALPKCSHDWVASAPPEGDVRASWPVALALAMLSSATAPLLEYYFVGYVPPQWPVWERSLRVVTASVAGFGGALLPYLLPPKTWRAAQELKAIRAGATADGRGGMVTYTIGF